MRSPCLQYTESTILKDMSGYVKMLHCTKFDFNTNRRTLGSEIRHIRRLCWDLQCACKLMSLSDVTQMHKTRLPIVLEMIVLFYKAVIETFFVKRIKVDKMIFFFYSGSHGVARQLPLNLTTYNLHCQIKFCVRKSCKYIICNISTFIMY